MPRTVPGTQKTFNKYLKVWMNRVGERIHRKQNSSLEARCYIRCEFITHVFGPPFHPIITFGTEFIIEETVEEMHLCQWYKRARWNQQTTGPPATCPLPRPFHFITALRTGFHKLQSNLLKVKSTNCFQPHKFPPWFVGLAIGEKHYRLGERTRIEKFRTKITNLNLTNYLLLPLPRKKDPLYVKWKTWETEKAA